MAINVKRTENTVDYSARETFLTLPSPSKYEPDVEFTAPVIIAPGHAFNLMGKVAEVGDVLGSVLVMKDLLGEDAYDAITLNEFVTGEVLGEIINYCFEKVAGAVQGN